MRELSGHDWRCLAWLGLDRLARSGPGSPTLPGPTFSFSEEKGGMAGLGRQKWLPREGAEHRLLDGQRVGGAQI